LENLPFFMTNQACNLCSGKFKPRFLPEFRRAWFRSPQASGAHRRPRILRRW
jgi:hypothetical protein